MALRSSRHAALLASALSVVLFATTVAPASAANLQVQLVAVQNAPGLAARDNQTIGIPPDTTGAIGPSDYVEVVNARIGVYPRGRTTAISQRDATAFWGVTPAIAVDPQVAWDNQAKRWYLVGFSSGGGRQAELMVAWSKTSDPRDLVNGWCRMYIPSGGNGELIDDFPKLGWDDNHLLIGTNVGDVVQRKVLYSRVWVIAQPKTVPGGCDTPAYTSFGSVASPLPVTGNRPAFTPVPVRPIGAAAAGYVISAQCVLDPLEDKDDRPEDDCGDTGQLIDVWRVTGPPDSPQLALAGTIPVPEFAVPEPVPQPGTDRRLDPSDTRLTTAESAPDPALGERTLIWTQHTVAGPGGRAQVAWYALDPQRLDVALSGAVTVPGQWAFNAAISPTSQGNQAIIDYNVGGPNLLPQIRARIAGQHGTELTLAGSAAANELCDPPPGDPYCHWGDYAGATPDPNQLDTVWGSNQTTAPRDQADAFGVHWRTQNFALSVRTAPTPTPTTTSPATPTHPATPTAPPTHTPTHAPTATPAPLAATGGHAQASLIWAGLLVAAGLVLVLAGRRRRTH